MTLHLENSLIIWLALVYKVRELGTERPLEYRADLI